MEMLTKELIKARIAKLELTPKKMVDMLDTKRQNVYNWSNGFAVPKGDDYRKFLHLLKLTIDEGGNIIPIENALVGHSLDLSVSDDASAKYLPVIDYKQACLFINTVNLPEDIEKAMIPENIKADAKYDYLLRVNNDTMYNPDNKKSLSPDDLVVVSSTIPPNIGDLVVAHPIGSDEAVIKLLMGESGNLYLEPLNERYINRQGFVLQKNEDIRIKGVIKAVIPPARLFIS